jgi:hypothetical protein
MVLTAPLFTNLKGIDSFKWKFPTPNIIQTDQEIWKVWAEIRLQPYIKNDYHCAGFHKTHAC